MLNFSAPINMRSYGIVGRQLLKAMSKHTSIALWPLPNIEQVEAPVEEHGLIRKSIDNQKLFDFNSSSLRLWHQFDMAQHVGKGMRVGFPIFELTRFKSNEANHLSSLDKILVTSKWANNILEDNGFTNVHVVGLGVDMSIFHKDVKPVQIDGIPEGATVFLNVGKWENRKGHIELIRTFNETFCDENVMLLLHCKNDFNSEQEEKQWVNYAMNSKLGKKGRILVIGNRFGSEAEVAQLMAAADCGVFPSKAEGWNMPLSEMMAMGKHVIATNYSGHTQFCNEKNCILIEVDNLEPADDGKWFDSSLSTWGRFPGEWAEFGEYQCEQLSNHMMDIHKLKQMDDESSMVNHAGIETMKQHSWDNVALSIFDKIGK